MSKLAERLAKRLETEHGIHIIPKVYRTYAGRHMRSQGAWSWSVEGTYGIIMVGSCYTLTECLKHKKWAIYADGTDVEILGFEDEI